MATKEEEDVATHINALREDIGKLTKAIGEMGSQKATKAVASAKKAGNQAVEEAEDILELGRDFGERNIENAEQWVQKNPLVAVLCALAAGFVLAHLRSRD